jgi:hypothetical protein
MLDPGFPGRGLTLPVFPDRIRGKFCRLQTDRILESAMEQRDTQPELDVSSRAAKQS